MTTSPEIAELIEQGLRASAGRRPTRPRPKPPAAPRLDPAVREALDGLTRALAAAAPEKRREVVAAVRARSEPAERVAVVGAVVQALLRSRSPDARAGLAAALVEFGPAAVGAVESALLTAKFGWQQAALAGVLEAVGPALTPGERTGLVLILSGVAGKAADGEALEAIAGAVAAIQLSRESNAGGGRPS